MSTKAQTRVILGAVAMVVLLGQPSAAEKQNWMNDAGMNLLVDYYPEVQFRPYGSGATRENVLPVLKELKLGYLCIYAKGHSGYTTWPSSLGTKHAMLGQDMPKFFREVCREAGCRLVFYYSGLLDGQAGVRHPEWRMKRLDGSDQRHFSDFGFITCYSNCPHSGYFDEWVAVQLRELVKGYEPDGIWVDGDWPAPCYCGRCQGKFVEYCGGGSWEELKRRPGFAGEYQKFWNQVTHRWRTRFSGLVKSLKADCLYSAGNVSPRREFLAPFDWRSGDFFSPGAFFLHDIARMMRWYGTLGVPYDAYICDTSFTHGRKQVRSRSKTLDRMLQEAATVAAGGGAVGYWTYPLGDGAWVPSRMKKALAVRKFLEQRADVFVHTRTAGWTAIATTDPAAPTFGGPNAQGAHKALAALHRSPDLIDESGLTPEMSYDLVVLPEQGVIGAEQVAALKAYVERGGHVLSSGASLRSPELEKLLGVKEVRFGAVADGHVRLKGCDEPTGVDADWDAVSLEGGAWELYPLWLSWDQLNPRVRELSNNWPMHGQLNEEKPERAGMPAAIARKIGRGLAVHVCAPIFSRYATYGDPQMLRWLREIVDFVEPEPRLATDAPSWVDVSLRRKGDRWLVHLVNQNPGRDVAKLNSDDTWVDEIPTIGPITCRLRLPGRPAEVKAVPGGERIEWAWERGLLEMRLPRLRVHTCLVVEDGGSKK